MLDVGLWALAAITWMSDPRAEQLNARWEADYAEHDLYTRTPIHLGFSRAFSKHFTTARGTAELNFETGRVSVSAAGLDPLPEGARYEVWLIDQVPGARNSAAIDLGEGGDRTLNLGALPTTGALVVTLNAETLANRDVDMAAVVRLPLAAAPS